MTVHSGVAGYALVETDSTGSATAAGIWDDRDEAVRRLDEQIAAAAAAGAPVAWQLFTLAEVPEDALWDWGVTYPGGRILPYVNKRAAESDSSPDRPLMRRRCGTALWEKAEM